MSRPPPTTPTLYIVTGRRYNGADAAAASADTRRIIMDL